MTLQNNPFQVKTPERLSSDETVALFVDDYTDYEKVKTQGHTFISGPRGIGKSMIFRIMQPDCQCRYYNKTLDKLDFLGFYIPLKNASFTTMPEMERFENNAACIINEHIMSVFFLHKVFQCLSDRSLYEGVDCSKYIDDVRGYYTDFCENQLMDDSVNLKDGCSIFDVFELLSRKMEKLYKKTMNSIRQLSFEQRPLPFISGFLYDYLDFVVPAISGLTNIGCFNHQHVYLLIDDAHCLTSTQTKVLNYWVSTRTSGEISLKISTQYDYKHYYTTTGGTIDTPHDYTEIDMWKVYTGSARPVYKKRIKEIVEKRLKNEGIFKTAEEFFPEDKEQEEEINKIKNEYYKKYDCGEGRGNRRDDDALRYARPDYIKSLAGISRSSITYSYAGFDQLVHLSSGVARAFLEDAFKMFAEESSRNTEEKVITNISKTVQNEVVRDDASNFLLKDLLKYKKSPDAEQQASSQYSYPEDAINRLTNLINGLGALFRVILLSDRAERRVFSITVSDTMSDRVKKTLDLGVQLGYFHLSTLGRKDSVLGGRQPLYVLNRRLSPIWNLDPTSFAGYLSVKNELLEKAMEKPYSTLRRIIKKNDTSTEDNYKQISMFSDEEKELFTVEVGE